MPFALSEAEIDRRKALLRRFKQLLEKKRAKFLEYLAALEAQEESIALGDCAKIEQQSMLAESIVCEIYTIQKALDPIDSMYRDMYSSNASADAGKSAAERLVPKLQADLEKLHSDIQAQNRKNRELLKSEMEQARKEIAALKKPYARKSVYASESESAFIIDIKT